MVPRAVGPDFGVASARAAATAVLAPESATGIGVEGPTPAAVLIPPTAEQIANDDPAAAFNSFTRPTNSPRAKRKVVFEIVGSIRNSATLIALLNGSWRNCSIFNSESAPQG